MITPEQITQRQNLETTLQIIKEQKAVLEQRMQNDINEKTIFVSKKHQVMREEKMMKAKEAEDTKKPFEVIERERLEHKLIVHAQREEEEQEKANIEATYKSQFETLETEKNNAEDAIIALIESMV